MKQQERTCKHRGELECQLQRAVERLKAVRRFATEDCEPCEVLPGLFLGSIGAARNLQALQREGITHVLNASPIVPCFHRRHLRYKVVTVYDDAQEDIAQFFEETNTFISKGRKRGGILVHCYAGMSRSATLALAYLISCEGMTLGQALHRARKARPCVSPNSGFMAQLERYSLQFKAGQYQLIAFHLQPRVPEENATHAASGETGELSPRAEDLPFSSNMLLSTSQ